tara:strand:- start:15773 stop:18073 length:2301 start_codon:yes stop_codon:yes gene_type:complete
MTRYHKLNSNFICNKKEPLSKVFSLIKLTLGYPIIVINDDDTLYGVISNGDILKFIRTNKNINFKNTTAQDVANQNPKVAHIDDKYETIEDFLSLNYIRTIPVVDLNRKVHRIVTSEKPYLEIGSIKIGEGFDPFLIAEIGVNHNGDINEAKFLIDAAEKGGCQAVKFQYRSRNLYNLEDINSYDLGTQYIISEINRTFLSIDDLKECSDFAKEKNLEVIITPFDIEAKKDIDQSDISVSCLKIASCDLTNEPLIRSCGTTNFPLIISTGMSFEREIANTSLLLRSLMVEHAFLHCNSTYPAPPEDINLSYISRLKEITKTVVGYSSHDGNINVPICSVSQGASIVEFHITRSKESPGTDHRASVEVDKINMLVEGCNLAYVVSGHPNPRTPSQGEIANRYTLGKSFALNRNYKIGEAIRNEDLILISPGHGFTIDQREQIIGKQLIVNKPAKSIINPQELDLKPSFDKHALLIAKDKLISKGYIPGIPVRYHDAERLNQIFNLPLLEFHMSDRDLRLNPKDYFKNNFDNVDLIVHAVEQFEDGFIFDLGSDEELIIQRSLLEIDKLINHLDKLRCFFNQIDKIPVVLNLGGFTSYKFIESSQEYFRKLEKAIDNLNYISEKYSNYEFLPQTMPPFPWHQGGRSFHNILTSKDKINDFLKRTDSMICFDVSHSYMSCKYFKESINEHIKLFSSRIKHIHLSDAASVNSEGLEIGEGSIDFLSIHKNLNIRNFKHYMIPEIWQGHLNNGEKFANSIIRFSEKLEDNI